MQYDFNKICRTCLSSDNSVKSIFSSKSNSSLLFCDMLMAVSTVKIEYNDGLPAQLCLKCIDKIMKAYSFKIECEKSEKILLNYTSEIGNQTESTSKSIEVNQEGVEVTNKYSCHDCNKSYTAASSLKKHFRTQHTDSGAIYKPIQNLQADELVKCNWCEYVFVNEMILKKHISSKHRNKELKDSIYTDETITNSVILPVHENISSAKCSFCNYVFENELHLKKHLLAKHLNSEDDSVETKKDGTCTLCGLQSKNVRLHMNEHYKHLYCTKCSTKFHCINSFEEHMKQYSCRDNSSCYLCTVCGKTFYQLSTFKIHSLRHNKGKLYPCMICKKSFTTPSALKMHNRTHSNERPYVCNVCGQSFKHSYDCTVHKRLHSEKLPMECNICLKRFNTTGQLNGHKRTHTGEKPYACNVCDKRFALSGTLRKHLLIHTGEKPHVCDVCGRQFSQSSSLLLHTKSHENM